MKRVLLCAALIAWSGMAPAVVYKWLDAKGEIQYGDQPPDGVHAEVVELIGNHAPRSTPGAASAAAPPQAPANAPQKPAVIDPASKQAIDNDVAETRAKQCTDAQDRYKKLIEGRRLYKSGADGERQYMNSEEIDSARLSAKHDVDSICNSDT